MQGVLRIARGQEENGYSTHVPMCYEGVCPSGGGHCATGCKCVGVSCFDSFVVVNGYCDGCGDNVQ